jgi:hypothetical protein
MELMPIEHECNGPTRYRVVVLTSWDRTHRNSVGQNCISTRFFDRLVFNGRLAGSVEAIDPRNHTNKHENFVRDISWYFVDRF